MPYKDRDKQRAFNRAWMAADRARKRERLAAESMAAWREMAKHPVANEWMSAEAVQHWAEFVLSLPTCEELFGHLTPIDELFPDLVPLEDVLPD